MRNAVVRLISRLDRAKEIISELENMSIKHPKLKCQEKLEWEGKKKKGDRLKLVGQIQKV